MVCKRQKLICHSLGSGKCNFRVRRLVSSKSPLFGSETAFLVLSPHPKEGARELLWILSRDTNPTQEASHSYLIILQRSSLQTLGIKFQHEFQGDTNSLSQMFREFPRPGSMNSDGKIMSLFLLTSIRNVVLSSIIHVPIWKITLCWEKLIVYNL